MKILMIARTCPYPANDGEKIRVFNLIKNLSHHEITLVCRAMSENEKKSEIELKKYCKEVYAVFIPRPKSVWEKIIWVLPFFFSKYPIGLSTVYFKKISSLIQELCHKNQYDVVQVEHSSLTIYLDGLSFAKRPTCVLIMHNIDYLRNERVIENLPFGIKKIFHLFNQMKYKQWEIKALQQYNSVVTMSEIDKDILKKEVPSLDIIVLPNGVDTKAIRALPGIEEKCGRHIIFVASMDSDANHDGAVYFIEQVLPIVKKQVSDTFFSFVGRKPRKELLERHNGKDIIVTGMVESVFDYYQKAIVAIVPLRSGGGTRLKILEAMAAGVPVVSTSIGAEGLNVINNEDILLADSPETFANSVVKLCHSSALRKKIIQKARVKVEQEYDWAIIAEKSDDLYRSVNR